MRVDCLRNIAASGMAHAAYGGGSSASSSHDNALSPFARGSDMLLPESSEMLLAGARALGSLADAAPTLAALSWAEADWAQVMLWRAEAAEGQGRLERNGEGNGARTPE